MPWIVLACISLVIDAFEILGAFLTLSPGGIIGSIVGIGLQAHYIDVVYSHKKEVEEQSRAGIVARESLPCLALPCGSNA